MNEIITFGKGYKLNKGIEVFVQSAKRYYNNVTVLDLDNNFCVTNYLKQNNVNTPDVKGICNKHQVDITLSPYTLKVILFYLYCKNYCTAENIFLTDFTDVYFQGNIFENISKQKVTVFSEENTIGNCQTNSTWINICYNRDILGLLKDKIIINGGCVLGTRTLIIQLLKEMCTECTEVISRIGNYQNIDQAILNKVVHFDYYRYNIEHQKIANMAQKKNKFTAWVGDQNVGFSKMMEEHKDDIPIILHQYDVNKQLEKEIYDTHCQ